MLSWNVGGRTELELVSLPDGKRTPIPAPPGEVAGISDISPQGDRMTVNVTGAAQPTGAWQYDFASQRYTQIAPVAIANVELSSLVKPELRKYKAQDGLELSGWLYLPKGYKQPGPVVLSFHGGPEGQERPSFRGDYQAILAQGIAVFAPNIRGSSGFGKAFLALDNHEKRFDANRDIFDSANYLLQSGVGAKGRLGIVGGSYGGYVVMVGGDGVPGHVRCRRGSVRHRQLRNVLRASPRRGWARCPAASTAIQKRRLTCCGGCHRSTSWIAFAPRCW